MASTGALVLAHPPGHQGGWSRRSRRARARGGPAGRGASADSTQPRRPRHRTKEWLNTASQRRWRGWDPEPREERMRGTGWWGALLVALGLMAPPVAAATTRAATPAPAGPPRPRRSGWSSTRPAGATSRSTTRPRPGSTRPSRSSATRSRSRTSRRTRTAPTARRSSTPWSATATAAVRDRLRVHPRHRRVGQGEHRRAVRRGRRLRPLCTEKKNLTCLGFKEHEGSFIVGAPPPSRPRATRSASSAARRST